MTATLEEMLATVPMEQRNAVEEMMAHRAELNRHYGIETPEGEVPVFLTMEQMKASEIEAAQALTAKVIAEHGAKRDLDDWFDVWHRQPRVISDRDMPGFAIQTILANCWTDEEERDLAQSAWTLPEWPGQWGRDNWMRVFAKVGFICTMEDCDIHADEFDQEGDGETLTVYRGSLTSTKRGMSWTTDKARAAWFAARGDMMGKGRTMHLWAVDLPSDRVEAHFGNRGEDEIVANVRGLRIREVQP